MSARRFGLFGLRRSIVLASSALGLGLTVASCASGGSTDGGTTTDMMGAGTGGAGGTGGSAGATTGKGGSGATSTGGTGAGPGTGGSGGSSGASAGFPSAGGSAGKGVGGSAGASTGGAGTGGNGTGGKAGTSAGGTSAGGTSAGGTSAGGTSAGGTAAGGTGVAGSSGNGEVCNGLDDNANGMIDEGDPGGGLDCDTGKLGECKAGTTHCIGGMIKCIQKTIAAAETCDGKDNNCDGQIDNAPFSDATGMACDTMKKGICAAGTNTCVAGKITCTQDNQPGMEVCNGQDDDCNGMIDEGSPGANLPCLVTGQPPNSPCAKGTTGCGMDGQIHCLQTYTAKSETCNGADDDCNGTIDDMLNGSPCDTMLPGVCGGPSSGTLTCANAMGNCVPKTAVGSQPELCNGKDDNCNGSTDEGDPTTLCAATLPAAQFVNAWLCTTGSCTIQSCALGHGNIDGAAANGCECATDSYSTSCSGVGNGISVAAPAGVQVMTGVVESAGGEKWFKINFSNVGAAGTTFHPRVELTDSGGGKYQMDVETSCGAAIGCPDGTGAAANVWEQNYNSVAPGTYAPGPGCCSDTTARVASVLVRISLVTGQMPGCVPFKVTATNPLPCLRRLDETAAHGRRFSFVPIGL